MGDERIDGRAGELAPLTDSLASCIRWRLSDYEAMLRSEMHLLLEQRRQDGLTTGGASPPSASLSTAQPRRPDAGRSSVPSQESPTNR